LTRRRSPNASNTSGDGWKEFLAAAASLAAHQTLTAADRWTYPALAALDDVLDTRHATLVGIDHAFTTEAAVLPAWITAVAHAADLDLPSLASQASAAMQAWDDGDEDVVEVIFARPPTPAPELDPSRPDTADVEFLTGALGATSDWIADTAYRILLNARNPEAGESVTTASQPNPNSPVASCGPGVSLMMGPGWRAKLRFEWPAG
jgi:hypothetical protein